MDLYRDGTYPITSIFPDIITYISRAASPFLQTRSPGVKIRSFIFRTRSCRNSGWHFCKKVTWWKNKINNNNHQLNSKLTTSGHLSNTTQKPGTNKKSYKKEWSPSLLFFLTLLNVSKFTWRAISVFSLSGSKVKELRTPPPVLIWPLLVKHKEFCLTSLFEEIMFADLLE